MAVGDVDVKITTPRFFKGASFDGVDDYVEIPHHDSQFGANLADGFTISAWIYLRTYGESSSGYILDKSMAGSAENGFTFRVGDPTGVLIAKINVGTTRLSAAASILPKNWYHVLITISSISYLNFYINGALSGTPDQDLVQPISAITTLSGARIGNRSAATDRTFDGLIRNVKMWNRVLTAEEIAKDYACINISEGQILNVPLQDDYNDIAQYKLINTNSGTTFKIIDDTLAGVISTQAGVIGGTTSGADLIRSGAYVIETIAGNQVASTASIIK